LLTILLEAVEKEGVKAWAIHTAFAYAIDKEPSINKAELWELIKDVYKKSLPLSFPDQEDPGQSFRRTGGDAFEAFIYSYLNESPVLKEKGIRVVRLSGDDFKKLIKRLGLNLRPKDIDMFLQGIGDDGIPKIFGAFFPKVSYAERIRADEPASRALMGKGLWCATVTLDARNELGTEQAPSVKRDTINRGAFDACYSFNLETQPGGRIFVVDLREKRMTRNPLIRDIVNAWKRFSSQ
jgi:hypothetical protein